VRACKLLSVSAWIVVRGSRNSQLHDIGAETSLAESVNLPENVRGGSLCINEFVLPSEKLAQDKYRLILAAEDVPADFDFAVETIHLLEIWRFCGCGRIRQTSIARDGAHRAFSLAFGVRSRNQNAPFGFCSAAADDEDTPVLPLWFVRNGSIRSVRR
jgi:hypothetical protein